MPVGVICNVVCVFVGTIIGALIENYVPKHLRESLPKVFGICSVAIGINSIVGVQTLSMVILATIVGYVIGELIQINEKVANIFRKALNKLHFNIEGDEKEYMETYLLVVLMFSMSGMGLFGALSEGMSGDSSVLMSKSVLDFFTAILFGTTLGYAQALISIPQLVILSLCFFLSKIILPYTNPTMILDFKACGGLLTMMTGLSVAKIIHLKAINLIPALVIVMPIIGFYQFLI